MAVLKKDSHEQMIVKQIEKDLGKLKEQLLQSQLDSAKESGPLTADQQQEANGRELQKAIDFLRKLTTCFWRFPEAEPVANSCIKVF